MILIGLLPPPPSPFTGWNMMTIGTKWGHIKVDSDWIEIDCAGDKWTLPSLLYNGTETYTLFEVNLIGMTRSTKYWHTAFVSRRITWSRLLSRHLDHLLFASGKSPYLIFHFNSYKYNIDKQSVDPMYQQCIGVKQIAKCRTSENGGNVEILYGNAYFEHSDGCLLVENIYFDCSSWHFISRNREVNCTVS